MSFENLPEIIAEKTDGLLTILQRNDNPVVCILGTASQGTSETLYEVDKVSDAAAAFASTGTLVRGMYEASIGGALNLALFRIGATSASLSGIGAGTGWTVETISQDTSAGTDYSIFFDASAERLRVYRVSDSEIIYDNNPAYPLNAVDEGEVAVSGSSTGSVTDIGTSGTPITLAAADGVGDGPAVYTAGTDGVANTAGAGALSRMEMYEGLYRAYDLLSDQDLDVVIPMNVYLDDLNVMDMSTATVVSTGVNALSTYPTTGADDDALGMLYVEEYLGTFYFWWWFPLNPENPTFSGAHIFPSAGSATATTTTDGTTLTASDFHEVNFAYQLATFCYSQSENNAEMTGVIGVRPPAGRSPAQVKTWIGTVPTTTEDANGNVIVTTNGTGLLGNKFMGGRVDAGGVPGHTVNGLNGLYGGGFIATDDGFMDGTELTDDNDHLVDIGKYISVVATYPILANQSRTTSYMATGAATYGGFYSGLPPSSAPTNKILKSVSMPFRVGTAKLDLLAGLRYVTFHSKTKGIVVSDAPTAARTDSDYRRLSTVRIVKACIDDIREVGEPFLGEGITGAKLAALETAVESKMKERVKNQDLQRYEARVSATPAQRVQGQAFIELKLVPAFELREITVTVALAAV
jgi:hypothetical protein